MFLMSFSYQVSYEGVIFDFSRGYIFSSAEVPCDYRFSVSDEEESAGDTELRGQLFRKALSRARGKMSRAVLDYPLFPDQRVADVISNQTLSLLRVFVFSSKVSDMGVVEGDDGSRNFYVEIVAPLYGGNGLYHVILSDENFKRFSKKFSIVHYKGKKYRRLRSVRVELPQNVTLPLFPVFVGENGEYLFSCADISPERVSEKGPGAFLGVGEGIRVGLKKGKYADYIVLPKPFLPHSGALNRGLFYFIIVENSTSVR